MKKATAVVSLLLIMSGCGGSGSSEGSDEPLSPTLSKGKEIYDNFCFSCHAPGLNGAPKLGDEEAWAPLIAKGRDLMLKTTIEGIPPGMPPRGVCLNCTDEELLAAIDYMIEESQ